MKQTGSKSLLIVGFQGWYILLEEPHYITFYSFISVGELEIKATIPSCHTL